MKLLMVVHHPLALWNVPGWFGQQLSQAFPQLQITQRESYEGSEKDLQEAEILFAISLRAEQLAAAPKLRWIQMCIRDRYQAVTSVRARAQRFICTDPIPSPISPEAANP